MYRKLTLFSVLLAVLASSFVVPKVARAAEYTSTTCTEADVQAKMNLANQAGDGVFLDCANVTYTAVPSGECSIEWIAPPNAYLRGRGDTSIVGGNNQTILIDNINRGGSNKWPLCLTLPATGVFDFRGITVRASGSGASNSNGMIAVGEAVGGSGAQFRIHHSSFDPISGIGILFSGQLYGVVDHSVFNMVNSTGMKYWASLWGGGSNTEGDGSWADDTTFGSNRFIYAEDNIFISNLVNGKANSVVQDSYLGSRFVVRFNTMVNGPATQTHPTGGSNRARGTRACEIYGNTFQALDEAHNFNVFFYSSGACLFWGNSAPTGFDGLVTLHSMRRTSASYQQASPASNGWGYCGPTYQTGTVTKSGTTVTHVSGPTFNTSWTAGSMILLNDVSHNIVSVADTTHLTVGSTSGSGTLTYVVGSNIDGNTDTLTGYPCLDAPGRGKGDRLAGNPPLNVDRSNADYTSANWNPRQALEPFYEWGNTFTSDTSGSVTVSNDGNFTENTDYYRYTGSFNGTTGIGTGVLASRPATCTAGVGYWATDVGDWNVSGISAIGQGSLYKCTATNVWTLYYEPYRYPHPLVDDVTPPDPPDPPPPPPPATYHLTFTDQPATSIDTGDSLGTVAVTVQDSDGATVTSATNSITLSLAPGSPAGALNGTLTVAAVAGVATFTTLTLEAPFGGDDYYIQAVATGITGALSNTFDVTGETPEPPVVVFSGGVLPDIQQQFFAANGKPLANGFVCTMAAGTTTPIDTFSNIGLTTANANPIPLNAAGQPPSLIFLSPRPYKIGVYAQGGRRTSCKGTRVGAAVAIRDQVRGYSLDNATISGNLTVGGQLISTRAVGVAPFSVTSTTPVASLTIVPLAYNAAGSQQTGVHEVFGTVALTAGAAAVTLTVPYTSATSYVCAAADETTAAAVRVIRTSASVMTLNGTTTNTIAYRCVGN